MRPVAVVAFAQARSVRREDRRNEVEMLMPVVRQALDACGLNRRDIGFFVSGSSDYLTGAPFAFVQALDAVGAWPPIQESHVEMDGADIAFQHLVQGIPAGQVRIGMRVEAVWRPCEEWGPTLENIAHFRPCPAT